MNSKGFLILFKKDPNHNAPSPLFVFTETSNFASFFKRQTGITPGAFREKPSLA